ncbi:MAG: hypothetical protein HY021_02725 [Burkholderiales bacterium]|nr:hypothetical protein [Burkholderiales bacterium]
MKFEQADEGGYRIYAGAMEGKMGDGYTAAMVIARLQGQAGRVAEAYRDPLLAGGHRWPTAAEALAYAMSKARTLLRKQPELLTH